MRKQNEKITIYRERIKRILNKDIDLETFDMSKIVDFAYDSLDAGEFDNALDLFIIDLSIQGDSCESLNGLAIVLCEKSEAEKAVVVMKRALELYPNDPVTVANVGTIFAESGDYAQAVHYLNRAIDMDPFAADSYLSLVEVYMVTGNPSMAFITCNTALKLMPEDELLSDAMKDILLEMAISG